MRRLVSPLGTVVRKLAFSRDGQTLAACEGDRVCHRLLRWWNVNAGTTLSTIQLDSAPGHVALSTHADMLVFANENQIVAGRAAQPDQDEVHLPWESTSALALTEDGKTLALAWFGWSFHQPGSTEIRLAPVADLANVDSHRSIYAGESVRGLAFSHDGRYLATVADTQLTLRDLELGESVLARTVSNANQLAFSPDAAILAVATGEYIQLWDVLRLEQRQTLLGHKATVHALAFSPDSRTLATGGDDRTVKLWDLADGKLIRTYEWPTGPVLAIAFAPDGLTAAAGGESGEIVIWDLDE